jgi:hypothetical protein
MAIVSRKQLAITLGVSERWVRQLHDDGAIRSADTFGYSFDEESAVNGFREWRRQSELVRASRRNQDRFVRLLRIIWTLTDEEREKLKAELDK